MAVILSCGTPIPVSVTETGSRAGVDGRIVGDGRDHRSFSVNLIAFPEQRVEQDSGRGGWDHRWWHGTSLEMADEFKALFIGSGAPTFLLPCR